MRADGRKPPPRLVAPKQLLYAQVVKVRNSARQGVEVSRRVVVGGPHRFGKPWRLRPGGSTIQTAFMARGGGGSLPCGAAPAMALGRTAHVWSEREYLWLPGRTDPTLTQQRDARMGQLLTPALPDQPGSSTQAPPHIETEKEAVPRPNAA